MTDRTRHGEQPTREDGDSSGMLPWDQFSSEGERDAVDDLMEEFVALHRRGERPSVSDFVARFPDHAERINELFPYVLMMEQFKLGATIGLAEESAADFDDFLEHRSSSETRPKHPELGDYILLGKLGSGGMGRVFKAQHRRMERVVALKVLPPAANRRSKAVQRFKREMKMAAKLFHPNIVTAFDAGERDGVFYLAMEYVNGQVFSRLIHEHGPLTVAKAVNYTLQAARGLEYAHSHEVVHRDVKPSNLVCADDGTVKILDFGLARFGEASELTHSGDILGTVSYMSPEQIVDPSGVDARSDIYSLGCTLFYMLTGAPPFTGGTAETIRAHKNQPPPQLCAARTDIPLRLDELVQRMLCKEVAKRFQTMTEVITELVEFETAMAESAWPSAARQATLERLPAVGIDVGNSQSQIARTNHAGQPVTVAVGRDQTRLPSLVSIDRMNIAVGRDANRRGGGKNAAGDVKYSLSLQRQPPALLDGRQYPPEVLYALILSTLIERARHGIADSKRIVLTVPNCFNETMRRRVYDAGYIAGLDVVALINDTMAAAITYVNQTKAAAGADNDQYYLVLQLGASTTSAAVIRRQGDALTTLASDGSTALGGRDFDDCLVDMVRRRVAKQLEVQLARDPGTVALLRHKCEAARRALSNSFTAKIQLNLRGRSISIEITRRDYYQAAADLTARVRTICGRVVSESNLDWGRIAQVLLAGGGTQMPLVEELVDELAARKLPVVRLPSDALAQGAALFAELERERAHGTRPAHKIVDVSAHDLAVVRRDRATSRITHTVLIPRNSPLPATIKCSFTTVKKGQESACIELAQRHQVTKASWTAIGKCVIGSLPPDLPAGSQVLVELRLSASGQLTIHIDSPSTRSRTIKEITRDHSLTNAELHHWRQWADTMVLCSGLM